MLLNRFRIDSIEPMLIDALSQHLRGLNFLEISKNFFVIV
ncbi:hypothetical protein LEP1GSC012_1912 [Leptospira interrogans serovar Valbuzzi str. Valbuzzi]|nr:hypothetical protein LEP1GSC012_1912 [Leptospira interrogans serovar Valbuzzi str. Valbuzzi]